MVKKYVKKCDLIFARTVLSATLKYVNEKKHFLVDDSDKNLTSKWL